MKGIQGLPCDTPSWASFSMNWFRATGCHPALGAVGGRGLGRGGGGLDAFGVGFGQNDRCGESVSYSDNGVAAGDGSGQRFAPFVCGDK